MSPNLQLQHRVRHHQAAHRSSAGADHPGSGRPLDEVEVIAQREKLEPLREELASLDEKFYAAYDRFNANAQYNTVCTIERRRGRRESVRRSLPGLRERG